MQASSQDHKYCRFYRSIAVILCSRLVLTFMAYSRTVRIPKTLPWIQKRSSSTFPRQYGDPRCDSGFRKLKGVDRRRQQRWVSELLTHSMIFPCWFRLLHDLTKLTWTRQQEKCIVERSAVGLLQSRRGLTIHLPRRYRDQFHFKPKLLDISALMRSLSKSQAVSNFAYQTETNSSNKY